MSNSLISVDGMDCHGNRRSPVEQAAMALAMKRLNVALVKRTPTYHKIVKYLVEHGLTKGQAHYVHNMIRELLENDKKDAAMDRHYGD